MKCKKLLSVALAVCMTFGSAAMLPENAFAEQTEITASAETQIVNNVNISKLSTVYIGEIIVDGESKIQYAYSDNISNSSNAISALKDSIINNEIGIDKIDINSNNTADGLRVSTAYQDEMNDDWKSSEKVAKKYFWGLLNEYSTEKSDMYDIDKSYKEYIENNHSEHIASATTLTNKDLMDKRIISTMSSVLTQRSSTVSPWGSFSKEVYEVYEEATSVIYTKTIVKSVPVSLTNVKAKSATCTEDGNIEYWTYDTRFFLDSEGRNEINKEKTIVKAAHTFSEWETVVAPTCTQEGSESRNCSVCNEKETREIKATGHNLTATEAKAATCTSEGNIDYWYCTTCKKYFSDKEGKNEINPASTVVKATGHNLTATDAKAATCTSEGNIAYWYCPTCKKYFSDKEGKNEITKASTVVKADDHKFSDWTTTNFDVKNGTSTQTRKCSVCGKAETKNVKDAVTRLAGSNRFLTAVEISKASFDKADTVVLAFGLNYADALAGVPLATKLNAPILLTAKDTLPDVTLAEINRLGAKKVIILGGTNAISEKVEKTLKTNKLKTERIAGKTRFGTATAIAEKLNQKPTDVFFVYGLNYADALSVGGIAAAKNAPIIYLTTKGDMNADTAAYLAKIKGSVKNAYVIGGTGVISNDMASKAAKALGLSKAARVAGSNRFLTCVEVNKKFSDVLTGDKICVATGMDFPDALAGGVYAAKNKAPLLLINGLAKSTNLLDEQKAYLKAKSADSITTFGGTNAVPDEHITDIAKNSI